MLRQKKLTSVGLVLILCFSTMSFKCGGEDRARQLAKIEDDISQAQIGIATLLTQAKVDNTISEVDMETLKYYLLRVNTANAKAIEATRKIGVDGNIDQDRQTELLSAISMVSDALVQLNNAGQLRIKDPKKRLAFNALVLTMQGAISTAVVLLVRKEK